DGVPRDIAFAAATDQIGTKPQPHPFGRHGAVVPQRPVGLTDAGTEGHLTGDGVEHKVVVLRLAVDEILHLLPFLPAVHATDFEDGTRAARHHRPVIPREALPGYHLGHPEDSVLNYF